MTTINVKTIDQKLEVTSFPLIASGGINEDQIQFEFDSSWNGLTKTAVFYADENNIYHTIVDGNGKCIVPQEVLEQEGKIYFGVFGVSGSVTKTSEVLPYKIEKGAITTGEITPEPTPDIYAQIMEAVGNAKIIAASINNVGHLIITTLNGQQFDAGSVDGLTLLDQSTGNNYLLKLRLISGKPVIVYDQV